MRFPRRHLVMLCVGLLVALATAVHVVTSVGPLLDDPWAGLNFTTALEDGGEEDAPGRPPALVPAYLPGIVVQVLAGSPAGRAGVEPGDVVVSVNGVPASDGARLWELTGRISNGDSLVYELRRQGKTIRAAVTLAPTWKTSSYLASLAASAFLALCFTGTALFVFFKRPADGRAALFFLMAVDVHALFLSLGSFSSVLINPIGVLDPHSFADGGWVTFLLYAAFGALLGPFLLHFALVFPRTRPLLRKYPRMLWLNYGMVLNPVLVMATVVGIKHLRGGLPLPRALLTLLPAGLLTACAVYLGRALFRAWSRGGLGGVFFGRPVRFQLFLVASITAVMELTRVLEYAGLLPATGSSWIRGGMLIVVLGLWVLASTLLYPVLTCVTMYRSYRESDAEQRAQVGWPLWGTIVTVTGITLVGLAGTIVGLFPTRYTPIWSIWLDVVAKLCYTALPISFAVSILKYRLMDIEIVLRRTVVYTLLTGMVVTLYLLLVLGVGGLVVGFAQVENTSIVIASTLAVAGLLVPVRNRVQSFVDRKFARGPLDHAEALATIRSELQGARSPNDLSERLAGSLQRTLRSRAVVVFRSNDGGATLRGVATVGLPDELVDALSLSGAAFADVGGPRAVDRTWPGESARSLRRARAQVLVPIRGGDTLHGAIGVGGKMSGEGFMPADLAFLESVAAHVAVVLASLTLRARDAEVGSALEIQRHLLPTCITQPPGYSIAAEWRPARVVAGDSYDVIPLDGSRIGLCIADASGKGMPAALLMSNLQATLRSLAPGLTSPAALARRINDLLHGNVALGKYFTFFYAVLEPDEKLLRFVNAGHNPPILVRRHGGVERLREGGMALGLFEDREYREGRVQLEPGDIVLLFTDGVTEVENAAGEEFGEARLMEIARRQRGRPAATAVAEVLEEAVRFGGAGELGDDATLLVLAVDAED